MAPLLVEGPVLGGVVALFETGPFLEMGLPERRKLLPLDAQLEVEIPQEVGVWCVGRGRRCKRLAEETLPLSELVLLTGDVDGPPRIFEGGEEWGIRTQVRAKWGARVRRLVNVGEVRRRTAGR